MVSNATRKPRGRVGASFLPGENFLNAEVLTPSTLPATRWDKSCCPCSAPQQGCLLQCHWAKGQELSEPTQQTLHLVRQAGQGRGCSPMQPAFGIRAAAEIKAGVKPQKCRAWLSRGAEGKSTTQEIDSIKK